MVHLQDLPTCLLLHIDKLSGGPHLQRAIFGVEVYIHFSIVKMNWKYFSSQKIWMEDMESKRIIEKQNRFDFKYDTSYLFDPLGYDSFLMFPNQFSCWSDKIKKHQASWKTRKKMSRLKTKFRLKVRMKKRSVDQIHKEMLFELEKRRWIQKVDKLKL